MVLVGVVVRRVWKVEESCVELSMRVRERMRGADDGGKRCR